MIGLDMIKVHDMIKWLIQELHEHRKWSLWELRSWVKVSDKMFPEKRFKLIFDGNC